MGFRSLASAWPCRELWKVRFSCFDAMELGFCTLHWLQTLSLTAAAVQGKSWEGCRWEELAAGVPCHSWGVSVLAWLREPRWAGHQWSAGLSSSGATRIASCLSDLCWGSKLMHSGDILIWLLPPSACRTGLSVFWCPADGQYQAVAWQTTQDFWCYFLLSASTVVVFLQLLFEPRKEENILFTEWKIKAIRSKISSVNCMGKLQAVSW